MKEKPQGRQVVNLSSCQEEGDGEAEGKKGMPFESRSATEVCKQLSEDGVGSRDSEIRRESSEWGTSSLGFWLVSKEEIERSKGKVKHLNDFIYLFIKH